MDVNRMNLSQRGALAFPLPPFYNDFELRQRFMDCMCPVGDPPRVPTLEDLPDDIRDALLAAEANASALRNGAHPGDIFPRLTDI